MDHLKDLVIIFILRQRYSTVHLLSKFTLHLLKDVIHVFELKLHFNLAVKGATWHNFF
ncbi:uncharacterized protein DS421_19g654020 [Arachis hypogaea]|uniref:Uncharacterized protein n=1 Tax=Arachis hypogaea TaxID=3818 RepID=A0A6B9VA71_ARAHY|nr:uncharacterized protein DS421_19g654020 [Arachis hypogaea]